MSKAFQGQNQAVGGGAEEEEEEEEEEKEEEEESRLPFWRLCTGAMLNAPRVARPASAVFVHHCGIRAPIQEGRV